MYFNGTINSSASKTATKSALNNIPAKTVADIQKSITPTAKYSYKMSWSYIWCSI